MTQKRYKIKIIALLMLIVFVGMFFVGCNLISTNNTKDMQQIVADVNLQKDEPALSNAFKTLQVNDFDNSRLNGIHLQNTTIIKRDLLSAYLSYGYQQVGSMSMQEVFRTIMTNLTNSRLNLQLAMLYYLYQENITVNTVVLNVTGDTDSTNGYTLDNNNATAKMQKNAFQEEITRENFNKHININNADAMRQNLERLAASYRFFLTEREENYILNTVNTSINTAIDRYERLELNLVVDTTDKSRTTPTGANQTNLYNLAKDSIVGIYTGYENATNGYTKLPGSTTVTRTRAFTQFLSSLVNNGLIERGENYTDITKLNYYLIECITQYESFLATKFSATIATLSPDIDAGVEQEYNRLKAIQQSMSDSEFITTMDSLTDTSAIVATPNGTYGYMYNLLIPFNASQEAQLKGYEDKQSVTYYRARNSLAQGIVAIDQRTPWITGATNYSFNADNVKASYVTKIATNTTNKNYFVSSNANNTSNYLFFNENFGQYGRAEGLTRYAGLYAYNGIVIDNNDGTLIAQPNAVPIEDFMKKEFEGYLKYILGDSNIQATPTQAFDWSKSYSTQNDYSFSIVYKNKVTNLDQNYYPGIVSGGTTFGTSYRALSAVNELVFAYSTDTGSLNKPYGYGMSTTAPTEYVPEFEYAGKELLKQDEGTYFAVVTDFGVHIMYLARKYTQNTVETYDKNKIGEVGSFSNFFYNITVNSVIGTFTSNTHNQYMEQINTNKTIKLYTNRYKDLYGR